MLLAHSVEKDPLENTVKLRESQDCNHKVISIIYTICCITLNTQLLCRYSSYRSASTRRGNRSNSCLALITTRRSNCSAWNYCAVNWSWSSSLYANTRARSSSQVNTNTHTHPQTHTYTHIRDCKMVLRLLMRYLANNEQLIQRMADSYPMRRAAQMVVSLMYRSKSIAREQGLHEMTPERFKWAQSTQMNLT